MKNKNYLNKKLKLRINKLKNPYLMMIVMKNKNYLNKKLKLRMNKLKNPFLMMIVNKLNLNSKFNQNKIKSKLILPMTNF